MDAHFGDRPRVGDARLYRKAAIVIAWWIASYVHALVLASSWWDGALSVISLAFASAAVPTTIAHDGAHAAFSDRRWLNSCAAWCVNLLGISTPWWRRKHGTLHHAYTRLNGVDDDLEQGALLRMHPEQPWRPWHRWQHLYAFALYPFLHLSMLVTGIRFLITGRVGLHQFHPTRRDRVLGWTMTAACFALLFGIPCLFREPWIVVAALLPWSALFGLILVLIFQVEHCVGEVESPPRSADSGDIELDWATCQVQATQNFATDSRLLTWYSGALNLHVEHHLFPRMSHTHYAELSRVIRPLCEEQGVRYRVVPTYLEALAGHARWLKLLGRGPDPAPAPLGSRRRESAIKPATSLPSGA